MFIIDIILRNTAATLSIQKKSAEDAEATYQQILSAMKGGNGGLLELTCDKQPGKKICVVASDISAVQIAEKTSTATSSGRPPGFFALAE
ncbi:MAG TPA: DUF3107 family protein [Leptolyngbyaceae cyanobacterium M33_DOE_097]|uniref:DUF3107 family protein n=1 Tax=Oscillatoriales cyanobacterium SpSt-418 TaxID=2282169 RepID=A0A7C3KJ68_9CYAN|nr:DUF3107 family protein [Leptolyngbyaceae cyanobacterium M33_DOE_097]